MKKLSPNLENVIIFYNNRDNKKGENNLNSLKDIFLQTDRARISLCNLADLIQKLKKVIDPFLNA